MAKPRLHTVPAPVPAAPTARTTAPAFRYRCAATHDDASAFRRRQHARRRLLERAARHAKAVKP